ncbi:cytochrome c class I [Sideroxydans lithotrophicus ES-1]|uniref:Cytochrome c class I n=2 Tax=Sideroxydans TaxID=314343 RepID=D5CNW1_SIDLE|nr:cytochrome c class I [Sideroxydans lithotrophicus ES-1]
MLSKLAMACWGAVAMLAFSGASFAEAGGVTVNVTNGKNIYENGKPGVNGQPDVPACAVCHGDKAMGNDGMGAPRLANIGYVYIVKQLTNFAEDKRMDVTMMQMNGIAKSLTEQDRRDLAAYENSFPHQTELSDLKQLKADGTKVGEIYKGEKLVQYGEEGRISACVTCHGYNGRGADPVYPKIGEQKYVYLVNQLTHWRDASRTNDPMGQMRAIAKNLTDDDIQNVAAYLSQAPDSSAGDGMQIGNQTVLKNIKVVK